MLSPTDGISPWFLSQIKDAYEDDDIIASSFTCMEFNQTGEFLAIGDRKGRISIYRNIDSEADGYGIYCNFVSHDPGFDPSRSIRVDEKINAICWLPESSATRSLLSANDKTIRLWRLYERNNEAYNFNVRKRDGMSIHLKRRVCRRLPRMNAATIQSASDLRVPKFRPLPRLALEVRLQREYFNGHILRINGMALNSDQETFISFDDVRINMWNFQYPNETFVIVDLKPPDLINLSEVITCARFHRSLCNQFAYSTSRGCIRICDLRISPNCDNHVLEFEDPDHYEYLGFLSNIVLNISDFRFSNNDQYILARDYLALKVWDLRMNEMPCEIYDVHDALKSHLVALYENDALFDKFMCAWSSDDRYISTGTYSNMIRMIDRYTHNKYLLELKEFERSESPDSDYIVCRPVRFKPSIKLPTKTFICPGDAIGEKIGLSTICVASTDTIVSLEKEFMDDSSSSDLSAACRAASSESDENERKLTIVLSDTEEPDERTVTSPSEPKRSRTSPKIEDEDKQDITLTSLNDPDALNTVATATYCFDEEECVRANNIQEHSGEEVENNQTANLGHLTENEIAPETECPENSAAPDEGNEEMQTAQTKVKRKRVRKQDLVKCQNREAEETENPEDIQKADRECKVSMVGGKFFKDGVLIPDMHVLECNQPMLRMLWHPKLTRITALSDKQIFVLRDKPSESDFIPSPSDLESISPGETPSELEPLEELLPLSPSLLPMNSDTGIVPEVAESIEIETAIRTNLISRPQDSNESDT